MQLPLSSYRIGNSRFWPGHAESSPSLLLCHIGTMWCKRLSRHQRYYIKKSFEYRGQKQSDWGSNCGDGRISEAEQWRWTNCRLCFVEESCDSTCNMWVEVNLFIQLIQKINKSINLDVVGNKGEVFVMQNILQLQLKNHNFEKFGLI